MRDTTTISRTLAVAIVLAGSAVGCTSSIEGHAAKSPAENASDADDFSGTYTVTYDDGLMQTWAVTSCGHGCADVKQSPHPLGGKGQARLRDDQWTMAVSSPTETDCGDGTLFPGITTWTWDASTQQGSSHTEQTVDACGDPAGDVFDEHSFRLTKS